MEKFNILINVLADIVNFVCATIFYLLLVRYSKDFMNTNVIEENLLKVGLVTIIVFSGYSVARPHPCHWSYTFLNIGWAICMFYVAFHFYKKAKMTNDGEKF